MSDSCDLCVLTKGNVHQTERYKMLFIIQKTVVLIASSNLSSLDVFQS